MTKIYTAAILPLLLLGTTSCHRGGASPEAVPGDQEYVSVPVGTVSRYQGSTASSNQDHVNTEDRIKSLQLMQLRIPSGKTNKFYKKNFISDIGSTATAQVEINKDYFGDSQGTGWAFMVANLPDLKADLTAKEAARDAGSFYGVEIDALKALVPPFPMSMTCKTIKFTTHGGKTIIDISPDDGSNGAYIIPGVSYNSTSTDYFQVARVVAAISLKVVYNPDNQQLDNFVAEVRNVPKKIGLFARRQYDQGGYYSNTDQGLTHSLNQPGNEAVKANLLKKPNPVPNNETVNGLSQRTIDFGHIYVPESYPTNPNYHMTVRLHFTVTQNGQTHKKYIDINDLPAYIKRNTLYEINVRLRKVYTDPEIEVYVKDWRAVHDVDIPAFT